MATKYKPGERDALLQARELLSSVNSPGSGAAERVLECAFRFLESVYTTIVSGTRVILTSPDSTVVKVISELMVRWGIYHHAERGAVALYLFHCDHVAPTPKLQAHLGDPYHQIPPAAVFETIPSTSSCCRSLLSPLENDALVGVEEVRASPVLWRHGRRRSSLVCLSLSQFFLSLSCCSYRALLD